MQEEQLKDTNMKRNDYLCHYLRPSFILFVGNPDIEALLSYTGIRL